MIFTDIFSIILRLAELAFAAIVAGVDGSYLHAHEHESSWGLGRFIYTEVVAGLSILLAIIWLFPFSGSFIHWPTDLVISIAWFVAFGLLVDWLNGACGYVLNWGNITIDGNPNSCSQWKASIAFSFLSAICWLVSAIVGIYWVRRHTAPVAGTTYHRRRWYRSRV
ncbi:membrane-associating domain-containing protein [Lasiosphaeria miniovina]|uniref:Membrane-associating domain-containing protein n=2 Tax=Lasiosphaeria TaxID=92901 RepID=A0AA40B6X6_9PEZI|nr:membrane-associating domain-containing protein [Lasiosphaeria miniovina]KAK0728717.1 membrane-associating domain-containing protein [Lasiosphaeria miniovina]KAK3373249.1 membrane-associating domain-containing protein [Lasiosphaeria ovina]